MIAVVGAGITGLCLAYLLEKEGKKVRVFEASNRVGGNFSTKKLECGSIIEEGPNSLLLTEKLEWLVEELGLRDSLIFPEESAKTRYILDGVLKPLPHSHFSLISSNLISTGSKFRILKESLTSNYPTEDESISHFFEKRFGREISGKVVAAAINGIYAASPDTLSMKTCLPKVWEASKKEGSVIRGLIKSKSKRPKICNLKEGLSSLPEALAGALDSETLKLSSPVQSITVEESGELKVSTKNSQQSFSKVFITCPLKASLELLAPLGLKVSSELPHASISVTNLHIKDKAFKKKPEGYGFLSPLGPLLGCIFSSNVFPHINPEKETSLFTMFSSLEGEEAHQKALKKLAKVLGIGSEDIETLSKKDWLETIPSPPVGHNRTKRDVSAFQENLPNIYIASSWLGGVGISERIETAFRAISP